MGTIWIKEFTGGLDTRRMPENTTGGVLVVARDGHITRGGEFEKRAAFVPEYTLPSGTKGLAYDSGSLIVFGSGPAPVLPLGINYQRLQHADGVTALARVLSFDLFAGKVYVAAEFADGARYHFYDGVRVADWFDGRARATFSVTGGTTPQAAVGSFDILTGAAGGGNQITNVTVNGVVITNGTPIVHTGNNTTTAAAVAAAINAFTSSPEYNAASAGAKVTITAAAAGTAPNGFAIAGAVGGSVTVGNIQDMAGGTSATQSQLTDLTVAGISIISAPVSWATSNAATAAAIAAAINSYTSAPDYVATAVEDEVNITAASSGAAANGRTIGFTTANGLSVSPMTGLTLASGSDNSNTFTPGSFVRTIGSKEYSVSGPNLHFSGVAAPTKWTTDQVGAGFIDMSSQSSGSEELIAVAEYQNYIAVFAEKVVQIWYVDADPTNNKKSQSLKNTGTASPRSVTQFGDNDLFYLDESGLRSLRARDASNAAASTDIGVPVDTLIVEKLHALSFDARQSIIGLIEPQDGRFWLGIQDIIFVFSFFSGSKVSAWSTYVPGFTIEDAVSFQRRAYLRSGNTIYVYGGLGNERVYDDIEAECWTPYLDAGVPTKKKDVEGLDAAVEGLWELSIGMEPTNEAAADIVARIGQTTYNDTRIPAEGSATHIQLRFKSIGAGPAKVGAAVIHFTGKADED